MINKLKSNAVFIVPVIVGSVIGYYIGVKWNAIGWELIYEVLNGAILGFTLGFGLSERDKDIFIGCFAGLSVCLLIDWLAGSPIDLRNKSSYMFATSFVGWGFWVYRKQVLLGGVLGAVIGFLLGLQRSHFFGIICLPPGLLNAILFSVQTFIIGMLFGSLYMKYYGWKFLVINK